MPTASRDILVVNKMGLHARPSMQFVVIEGAPEMFGELLDAQQVSSSCSLGMLTTLEFVENHFS